MAILHIESRFLLKNGIVRSQTLYPAELQAHAVVCTTLDYYIALRLRCQFLSGDSRVKVSDGGCFVASAMVKPWEGVAPGLRHGRCRGMAGGRDERLPICHKSWLACADASGLPRHTYESLQLQRRASLEIALLFRRYASL